MFSILCVLLRPLSPLPSGSKQGMLMNCSVKFNPFYKVKTIFLLAEGIIPTFISNMTMKSLLNIHLFLKPPRKQSTCFLQFFK